MPWAIRSGLQEVRLQEVLSGNLEDEFVSLPGPVAGSIGLGGADDGLQPGLHLLFSEARPAADDAVGGSTPSGRVDCSFEPPEAGVCALWR